MVGERDLVVQRVFLARLISEPFVVLALSHSGLKEDAWWGGVGLRDWEKIDR